MWAATKIREIITHAPTWLYLLREPRQTYYSWRADIFEILIVYTYPKPDLIVLLLFLR